MKNTINKPKDRFGSLRFAIFFYAFAFYEYMYGPSYLTSRGSFLMLKNLFGDHIFLYLALFLGSILLIDFIITELEK